MEGIDIYIDWLNLDNLIENININSVNIVIMTKINNLSILKNLKIYYKNKTNTFNNLENFKNFLKDKIEKHCNISYLHFIYNI